MLTPKILVVDDEQIICDILEFNLLGEGYEVSVAKSAEDALAILNDDFSLIIVDVMMQGMSGYRMVEKLRKDGSEVPVIFCTAKDAENDMLTGFSVGGDDYIVKPFSVKEVIARVKAILKRGKASSLPESPSNCIVCGDFQINVQLKEVSIGGEQIFLTRTEFEIVLLLASKPQRIFSRQDIIDRVWQDTPYITERTVDVHIARLRKKLGKRATLISNRSGFGYRFHAEE